MHHSEHNNEIIDNPQQENQEVEQMAIENNEQIEQLNGNQLNENQIEANINNEDSFFDELDDIEFLPEI
uniref:Candidate secreted effector n=1 Tax=Meloidogyne incognita TaxID=6306 RepID=A0A914NDU5_MELIC